MYGKDLDEGTILGKSLNESNGKLLLGTGFRFHIFVLKKQYKITLKLSLFNPASTWLLNVMALNNC